MKKLNRLRRAGALCLACMVLVLFSVNVYLQASETEGIGPQLSGAQQTAEIKEAADPGGHADQTDAGEERQTQASEQAEKGSAQTESVTEKATERGTEKAMEPGTEEPQDDMDMSDVGQGAETAERPGMDEAQSDTQTEAQSDTQTEAQSDTQTEARTGTQPESGTAAVAQPESGETEENSTEDAEEMLDEVLEEAQKQDIDFLGLAPGESLTFYATVGQDNGIMPMAAVKATKVTVVRATQPYRYKDYGLGTHQTYKYTVTFNDITATAYCIQPYRDVPGSSSDYTIWKLGGARELAKVCYYGTKAAGSEGFFAERHSDFDAGKRFIITHMAAAYANGSTDAFVGANGNAKSLAMELYEYCQQQPDIPDADIAFSDTSLNAYIDIDEDKQRQRTKEIKFTADRMQSVTFQLPAGVILHDLSKGTDSAAGQSVTIEGGTRFYLSAPLNQAMVTGPVWSTVLKGSIKKDYSAYKIFTGSTTQDLALVFGDGIEIQNEADFSVKWLTPISIRIRKTDAKTGNGLQGAVFGVYADPGCTRRLATLPPTDAAGTAEGTLYRYQDVVYLCEDTPRSGYLCGSDVRTLNLASAEKAGQTLSYSFADDRLTARLRLTKRDAETGKPQGDAVLAGAVYGLYAREDIVHPDGVTGVLYRAGEQVAALTTDENGEAVVDDLYLGKYYVREITPSNGYLLDEKEYDIVFADERKNTDPIEKKCLSEETVIRQPFQLIKISGNGKDDADPLEGAGFTAYLVSSLSMHEDGSYDFSSAEPVSLGPNGETEIFTDKDGQVVSAPLPFGIYVVRETTVPEGHEPVGDFEVRITENAPTKPQAWRVLIDKEFKAKLKIIKNDDETQKNVLAANTEFRVYDLEAEKYVVQVTTYPKEEVHESYFTDEEGCLILPESLPRGHYRIEEITAPDGYTVGDTAVEVTVDKNMAYRMDEISDDAIIEVIASNHPVKGELKVVKKGEFLKDHRKNFVYEELPVAGAVYEVYAAEDIYTADLQREENGERILEYAQGTLVGTLTTGEDGEGVLGDLPLGKYRVVEKTAPNGFVRSEEEQYAQFVYVDQNTPVVTVELTYVNERQKAEITVIKKDADNGALLAGAKFGLFAAEDIVAGEETVVEADTQLATALSGSDGKAVFEQDLPFGSYYVRELEAPEGYLPSDERVDLSFSYAGQDTETVRLEAVFENEPTVTEFTKSDITTGTELDGATLTILDRDGNVVESWVSVKDAPHMVKGLHVGETYRLREELAPYGYLRAEEVEFTVEQSGEVQKVKMEDGVPVGRIIISKTGEFASSVTWNEMVAGTMEAVFGYVSGSLREVVFEVYAAEDIRAADGVSENYYAKDDLVATITTDSLGYARTENLPLGKYYVVEKKTAEGYVLDGKPREIDLTYRDQDTPVVTYDEKWQNSRQRVRVSVLKREKESGRALAGGIFALCAGEDIKGTNGEVLLKADAVIEQKATGADGTLVFTADLPLGAKYRVKEVKAPPGYVTTGETQEFVFSYAGESTKEVSFDFTFENQPTQIKISKLDITTGKELPGAKLQVRDEKGDIVDQWTSKKKPHIIRGLLEAGKVYTLREESAPKGYVIAEEIRFKVQDTLKVQVVKMKDDRAPASKDSPKKSEKAGEAPKTGDETDFLLPGMMMGLSGCVIFALAFIRRRKKKLS